MDLNTPLENVVFCVFDTETTGDNTKREDKPIEIAAVKWTMKDGFLEIPKSWMVDPEMSIHPSAVAVHGIEDEEVIGKPKLEEILPEFLNYVDNTVLLAHNINFDLNMLPVLKEKDNPTIDTLRFARQIYKIGDLGYKGHDLRSHKSQELRYWLGIKIDTMGLQAHRAAADILVTGEVFKQTLTKYLEMTKGETLKDLLDFVNSPIMIEKMNFGKFKDRLISEVVKEEASNPKNYFAWLLREVNKGNMNIDPDLKYTIEYHLKQNDIDPNALLVEEPIKDWKGYSKSIYPKKKF
jgi:DNA polymerase III epsilon subunit family exonuclease